MYPDIKKSRGWEFSTYTLELECAKNMTIGKRGQFRSIPGGLVCFTTMPNIAWSRPIRWSECFFLVSCSIVYEQAPERKNWVRAPRRVRKFSVCVCVERYHSHEFLSVSIGSWAPPMYAPIGICHDGTFKTRVQLSPRCAPHMEGHASIGGAYSYCACLTQIDRRIYLRRFLSLCPTARVADDATCSGCTLVGSVHVDERNPPLFVFEGGHLCAAMHAAGLNLRYLPAVRHGLA